MMLHVKGKSERSTAIVILHTRNLSLECTLKALTHQKPSRQFCTLFFELYLPFTTHASSVNGKTSKKSRQKRRGGFWCVKTLSIYVGNNR